MPVAGSAAGDFDPRLFEIFGSVARLLGHIQGAVGGMSRGMARAGAGGPWNGASGRPKGARQWPPGPGGPGGPGSFGGPWGAGGLARRARHAGRRPAVVMCAPRSWPCCAKARVTGTRSCPRSRTAAAAPAAQPRRRLPGAAAARRRGPGRSRGVWRPGACSASPTPAAGTSRRTLRRHARHGSSMAQDEPGKDLACSSRPRGWAAASCRRLTPGTPEQVHAAENRLERTGSGMYKILARDVPGEHDEE